jgi:hypothetical protein
MTVTAKLPGNPWILLTQLKLQARARRRHKTWGLESRLMCGDSTDESNVRRLAKGLHPVWMWADPPYGVDYVGKTKDALKIHNDAAGELPELLQGAFACAGEVLAQGAPIYVLCPWSSARRSSASAGTCTRPWCE